MFYMEFLFFSYIIDTDVFISAYLHMSIGWKRRKKDKEKQHRQVATTQQQLTPKAQHVAFERTWLKQIKNNP